MSKLKLIAKVIVFGGWTRATFYLLNYPSDVCFVLGVVSVVGLIGVSAFYIKQFLTNLLK
jgi:hypothetical protein